MFYRIMEILNKPAFGILLLVVVFSCVSNCEIQEKRGHKCPPFCDFGEEAEREVPAPAEIQERGFGHKCPPFCEDVEEAEREVPAPAVIQEKRGHKCPPFCDDVKGAE